MKKTIVWHCYRRNLDRLRWLCKQLKIHTERQAYIPSLFANDNEIHVIWGSFTGPDLHHRLGEPATTYYAEHGWFTQRHGWFLDKRGTCASSTLPFSITPDSPLDEHRVASFFDPLHREMGIKDAATVTGGLKDYVFVPLQIKLDSHIQHYSVTPQRTIMPCMWMLGVVCEAFPNHTIIVRPHPKAIRGFNQFLKAKRFSEAVAKHKGLQRQADGTSYQWASRADIVVGFNSTVLLEALSLGKRVATFGDGVFSGNGVTFDVRGQPAKLAQVQDWSPDTKRVRQFLHLLIERQIPYNLQPDDVGKYPVLQQMIRQAQGK